LLVVPSRELPSAPDFRSAFFFLDDDPSAPDLVNAFLTPLEFCFFLIYDKKETGKRNDYGGEYDSNEIKKN